MTTGAARRLPAPRPALRKAADAEHHPAAGPSTAVTAALPAAEEVEPEPTDTGPSRSSGPAQSAAATAFWDALQADAAAALQRNGSSVSADGAATAPGKGKEKPRGKGKKPAAKKKFQGTTSDTLRKDKPEQDLLLGKQVALDVKVPKRLRKAATAQAERHGTTLDNVVTGLLAGWVDGS